MSDRGSQSTQSNQPARRRSDQQVEDLEIKDARLIFNAVWEQLESEFEHEDLRFPKEIILLGGAPGSGKGTNTEFIKNARSFTCPPIIVSDLLNTPEAQRIKAAGGMVGDREVITVLFSRMLNEDFRDGAILDGFPRTKVQVEVMKLLVDKIDALHREFQATDLAVHFRKPIIHVMVLFVEEATSITRQLHRGKEIAAHNAKVDATGDGEIRELRKTDLDPEAAKHRYRVFKEKTWSALKSLRQTFFYHFINAEGSFQEVEQNILEELKYQSSLELDERTFDRLRKIPLASEIVVHARQELVRRLDTYELQHTELFKKVVAKINRFMTIVVAHAISGHAAVNTTEEMFHDRLALEMLIDIFSERGYHAVIDKRIEKVPAKIDLQTGKIDCDDQIVYRIQIHFQGSEIRRG
ncbi:MAG: nucleoside monophosphate kinase [Limisphaerales bacterium]